MKILFDNVDLASTSGPNSFAAKLAFALRARGHTIVSMIGANQGTPFDVALAFIQHGVSQGFDKPIVARLGGMHYMNDPRLSWEQNNAGNFTLYQMAEHVIFQNAWCKGLYSSVIYPLDNSETTTISNGTGYHWRYVASSRLEKGRCHNQGLRRCVHRLSTVAHSDCVDESGGLFHSSRT